MAILDSSSLNSSLKMFSLTVFSFALLALIHLARGKFIGPSGLEHDVNIQDGELLFSHTLCRHGDRNIYGSYPNDPWKSEEHWPGGYAKLTDIGWREQYALGKYLRQRYWSLIGDGNYSPNTVFIQTTDVDRVIKSSKATAAGLFSSGLNQSSNEILQSQTIPVYSPQRIDDYVLAADKRCDRFDYKMSEYMNTNEFKDIFKQHKSLIRYLEANSGKKLPTLTEINILYDTLFIENLKGKKLPAWAEEVMIPNGDFEFLMKSYFEVLTHSTAMKRLKSGFLLKDILDRFTNKTQSTLSPNRSLWMYFAHDITITSILNSMGLFKLHQPPYSSCIFFELFKGVEKPYVQIFYKNSSDTNIPALEIPGCGTKCSLDAMYNLYADILPNQSFSDECALQNGEVLPEGINLENNSL